MVTLLRGCVGRSSNATTQLRNDVTLFRYSISHHPILFFFRFDLRNIKRVRDDDGARVEVGDEFWPELLHDMRAEITEDNVGFDGEFELPEVF